MKKKLAILTLILIAIPVLAFFGCGSKETYSIKAVSSWTGLASGTRGGTVEGSGKYKEGSTVTLTATAKPESRFLAWVYEDSVIIKNNNTYSIKNQGSDGVVSKSKLTFKANSKNKGIYYAIFDDTKILYTKLTSWRITNDYTTAGEDSATSTTPATLSANLYIAQGTPGTDVYSAVNFEVRENVINEIDDINQVFKLNGDTPKELTAEIHLTDGLTPFEKEMTAKVPFAETMADFILSDDGSYSYKSIYLQEGKYQVVYKFTFSNADKYLVVEYTNLTNLF